MPEYNAPESFNVMIKELQGLCIDVERLIQGVKLTYIQSNNIDTSKKYCSITIGLSPPETLLARSYGEVLKPRR